MDGATLCRQRRFHQRLGQRRVGVDREVELLHGQPVLDGEGRLRDQVGRPRADDVRAQELARLRVGEDLRVSLRLAERQRATRRGEREAADLDRDPLLLGLLLAQADVRDFRVGVDAVRRGVIVGCPPRVARDVRATL